MASVTEPATRVACALNVYPSAALLIASPVNVAVPPPNDDGL